MRAGWTLTGVCAGGRRVRSARGGRLRHAGGPGAGLAAFRATRHEPLPPRLWCAAMKAKAAELPGYQQRLHQLDTRGWAPRQQVDYRLIEAEMNGLDFDLRVRQPWARDPSFYATVFGERSDVPQHEGASAAPTIDLFCVSLPAVARGPGEPDVPAGRRTGAAGAGEDQSARQQRPRPVGLQREHPASTKRGAGRIAGRDAHDAHPGGRKAREPRGSRTATAAGAGARARSHRSLRWLDRVARRRKRPVPPGSARTTTTGTCSMCIWCPTTGTSRSRCCAGNWSAPAQAWHSRSSATAPCRRSSPRTRPRPGARCSWRACRS